MRDQVLLYHQTHLPERLSDIVRKLILHEQQPAADLSSSAHYETPSPFAATPDLGARSDKAGSFHGVAAVVEPPPTPPGSRPARCSLRSSSTGVRDVQGSPLKTVFDASSLPWSSTSTPVPLCLQDEPLARTPTADPALSDEVTPALRRQLSLTRRRGSMRALAAESAPLDDTPGTLV